MTQPDDPGYLTFRTQWVGLDELTVVAANQFALNHQAPGHGFVLNIGHVAPPILIGTPEEQQRQAEEMEFLPIRSVARFALTDAAAKEFLDIITAVLGTRTAEDSQEGDDE